MFTVPSVIQLRSDMVEVAHIPDWLAISDETCQKLCAYLELVKKWNPKINLVSTASLDHAWSRHVLDSAQLWDLADLTDGIWLDIGSGGGFPGLVISVIAQTIRPNVRVVLVESDRRKSVFLSEAIRQLDLSADIHCARIENLAPVGARVVSARALAPVDVLLPLVHRHMRGDGTALLMKGRNSQAEVAAGQKGWAFEWDSIASKTDVDSSILKITALKHG